MAQDERLIRNIEQLNKAFITLVEAIKLLSNPIVENNEEIKKSVKDSIIQRFEYTYELFWKVFKRLASSEGIEVVSPKEAFNYAFKKKFIAENYEAVFNEILKKRNLTVHTYNEATAKEILNFIIEDVIEPFKSSLLRIDAHIQS